MKIVQRKVNFTNLLLLKRIMMTTFCFLGKVVQDFPALFFLSFVILFLWRPRFGMTIKQVLFIATKIGIIEYVKWIFVTPLLFRIEISNQLLG